MKNNSEKPIRSSYPRTFRIDKLYYQFLKPKGIAIDDLKFFVGLLVEHGFIRIESLDLDRYSETEKLVSRQNKMELFNLIASLNKE